MQVFAQSDDTALPIDSINISANPDTLSYQSPIEEIITYPARDSTIYDLNSQKVYMYGNAKVTYTDITLEAEYIEFDFDKMLVKAYGLPDTAGTILGKPQFIQGGQSFSCDTMTYNFDTERGIIEGVVTQEGDSYVHAEISKKQDNGHIHNLGGKYTTCSLDNPHYHFRFKKMVVIPNDKIVTGPVYMKIRKVPLPLGLPFGFFPNTSKQQAGILIPSYGTNAQLGFFLINGGYYQPINEHLDTKLTGDIYSRGSWGLRSTTRYIKRYNYSGNIDITYNKTLNGDRELNNFSKVGSFFVRWNHRQDGKARPGVSFSAEVNAGTSNNFTNNFNASQNDYISSTFASSVNYSKRWSGSQLTLSARHNQNTQTRDVTFTLPQIGFNVDRFFLPLSFLRASSTGPDRWYENIGVTYRTTFENSLRTSEPELRLGELNRLTDDFRNGINHRLAVNTNIKAGYITINPSFTWNERWHFARAARSLEGTQIVTDTISGFNATRDYQFSTTMNTKVYGMYNFKGNGIKTIRHVMTPSIGLTYSPEFDYQTSVRDSLGIEQDYNPYTVSAFTQTGFTQERGAVTFGLQNNIEAKVKTKRDSTGSSTKKVKLLENLTINSSYNLMADSLNLAPVRVSARTTLYKGTVIQYNGTFSPYQVNSNGRNINRFIFEDGGPLLRADQHSITLNTTLSGGESKKKNQDTAPAFANTEEREDQDQLRRVDFSTPWNLTLAYTFTQRNSYKDLEGIGLDRDAFVQQNLLFTGDIRIMKKWKVGVSSGYDLVEQEFSPTEIRFFWDLHCWEFNTTIIPNGDRKSYRAFIGIKAPILSDLKYEQRGQFGNDGPALFQ